MYRENKFKAISIYIYCLGFVEKVVITEKTLKEE